MLAPAPTTQTASRTPTGKPAVCLPGRVKPPGSGRPAGFRGVIFRRGGWFHAEAITFEFAEGREVSDDELQAGLTRTVLAEPGHEIWPALREIVSTRGDTPQILF